MSSFLLIKYGIQVSKRAAVVVVVAAAAAGGGVCVICLNK